jgi:glycosyltransferase involved in cell wall biosynthesis
MAQTWKNIETIVVDDGSKDQTEAVLKPYGQKVRYIRQHNQGPSAARNNGIRVATGQIISFLDSDDEWLPEKIERQVRLMLAHKSRGVVCAVCNAQMNYPGGIVRYSFDSALLNPEKSEGIWLNPSEVLVTRFLLFNQVAAVWRDALDEAGHYRPDLRIHEDYELSLRIAMLGPWVYITDPLTMWHGTESPSASKVGKDEDHALSVRGILEGLKDSTKWGALMPEKAYRHRHWFLNKMASGYTREKSPLVSERIRGKIDLLSAKFVRRAYLLAGRMPKMDILADSNA